MELPERYSGSIIMDHAYAVKEITVKIEKDDSDIANLSCIKLEDISIKTEPPEDEVDVELPSYSDFAPAQIKKEETDTGEGKSKLEWAERKIAELIVENESLRLQVQQSSKDKAKLKTIEKYQADLSNFEELKRYHVQVEKHIVDLRTKMLHFADKIIPEMERNHFDEIEQLKNELKVKNQSILKLNREIDSLSVSVDNLSKKIAPGKNSKSDNNNRADQYESKWKIAVESQKLAESTLKSKELNLSKKRHENDKLTRKYAKLVDRYHNSLKRNEKMIKEMRRYKKEFEEQTTVNKILSSELKNANKRIEEMTPCQYCGL